MFEISNNDVMVLGLVGTALFAVGCVVWMIVEAIRAPILEDEPLAPYTDEMMSAIVEDEIVAQLDEWFGIPDLPDTRDNLRRLAAMPVNRHAR